LRFKKELIFVAKGQKSSDFFSLINLIGANLLAQIELSMHIPPHIGMKYWLKVRFFGNIGIIPD